MRVVACKHFGQFWVERGSVGEGLECGERFDSNVPC
jgi:hypothetical protein